MKRGIAGVATVLMFFAGTAAAGEEKKQVASLDPTTLSLPTDAPVVIATPRASDEPAKGSENAKQEKEKLGIGLGATFGSAYSFRGLNLYKAKKQLDQAFQLAPWASYAMPHTGFVITYFSSYQAAGAAAAQNRKAGLSHEEDVILGYRFDLPAHIALTPGFTGYAYPFATKEAAGTNVPIYIEPSFDFFWASGVVDVDVQGSYFHGIQSALKNYRYGYLHAQLGRTAAIKPWVGVETAVGYGHKIYVENVSENRDDVSARIGVPFTLSDAVLKPALNWAWTNLKDQSMGQEYFVFGSLDASYAL